MICLNMWIWITSFTNLPLSNSFLHQFFVLFFFLNHTIRINTAEKKFFVIFEFLSQQPTTMADWGPVFVAVVLFVLLTPGLLVQMPGKNRFVEFGNFHTSGVSILVHSVIYFALICIFLLAVGVHVYMGGS